MPAIRPYTTHSRRELPASRLLPCTPPEASPAAYLQQPSKIINIIKMIKRRYNMIKKRYYILKYFFSSSYYYHLIRIQSRNDVAIHTHHACIGGDEGTTHGVVDGRGDNHYVEGRGGVEGEGERRLPELIRAS